MESRIARLNRIAPRRIRAQAALWVTDLHGPQRDARMDIAVKRWIAEDPRHAAAFELATEAWQKSGEISGRPPLRSILATSLRPRRSRSGPALAGAAGLCGILMAAVYYLEHPTFTTGPGEQRTVQLSDGTQVSLNANSSMQLEFDQHVRKVSLARGEALFTVAKHQTRPFVVVIGDRKIIAVGTSFVVRREEARSTEFAVTLMEGRVAVEPLSWPDALPLDAKGVTLLNPGERLRFEPDASQRVDLPAIEKVTAWQRGRVILDDMSLTDAAAEFNRYGSKKMVVDDSVDKELRVGGVFQIGDPTSFARAMASAYHLKIINRGAAIVLTSSDEPGKNNSR